MRKAIVETLEALQRDLVLSPDQRAETERRLRLALAPRDHGARFVAVVATLGAVLVAAGILYLVGYHWEELGKPVKLGLIFGLWAAIHAAGCWLTCRGRYPLLGQALTVLGVLCFGAAIGLVAQVYHLSSHYPNAVLAWWALNVPVLLWSKTRAVQVAVTAIFVVWCHWHLGVYLEHHSWRAQPPSFGLLEAGLAVLFLGLGQVTAGTRFSHFAPLWRALAWLGVLVAPFVLAFEDFWDLGEPWSSPLLGDGGWVEASRPLHGYLLALLAGCLLLLPGLRRPGGLRIRAGIVAGTAVLLGLCAVYAPPAMPLLGNLVQLALLVLLVRIGTRAGRPALVNVAVALFCVVVFVRYAEYLWDKLAGAYAFLGLGVLLLGLGWCLERQRRRWVAASKEVAP